MHALTPTRARDRAEGWIVTLLLGVLPAAFALRNSLSRVPIALAFLLALALLATRPALRATMRRAAWAWLPCLLALLYTLANAWGHRRPWSTVDLPSQMLAFMAMAALFALPLRTRLLGALFSLTAGLLGLVSIIQYYALHVPRPYGLNGGQWAAIEFAMLLLVMSLIAVQQLARSALPRRLRLLHGLCAGLGFFGAVLTQSRGPLLAALVVGALLALWHARRSGRWRPAMGLLAAMLAVGVVAAVSLHSDIVQRFELAGRQAARFDPQTARGSIPERLEMWHVAWRGFLQHPLAGVGVDGFGDYARTQIAAGRASRSIAQYNHPHNEYLEAAVSGGVPGVLALLAMFLVPLWGLLRQVRRGPPQAAAASEAGLLVIAMYMLCAMTDNVFYRAMPHSLYFFLVLGLAVRAVAVADATRT